MLNMIFGICACTFDCLLSGLNQQWRNHPQPWLSLILLLTISVLYGTFLHQGNIGKVLVAFLWLIYEPHLFKTIYCMWNKSTQKQFSYESYYNSSHHIMAKPKLWMHCLWQLPKGFKDSAISQGNRSQKFLIEAIFTCFFFVEVA